MKAEITETLAHVYLNMHRKPENDQKYIKG